MNAQKALGAELLAALGIATIGAGKFPPPHRYTGVFLLWFVLGLVAQVGNEAARFATALGALVVLAMAMGQAGARLLGWTSGLGSRLGVAGAGSTPAGAGGMTNPTGATGPGSLFGAIPPTSGGRAR